MATYLAGEYPYSRVGTWRYGVPPPIDCRWQHREIRYGLLLVSATDSNGFRPCGNNFLTAHGAAVALARSEPVLDGLTVGCRVGEPASGTCRS